MRILLLLSACLLLTGAAKPKPRAASNLTFVGTCPATGTCSLKATWTLPSGWRTGDSLKVQWTQTTPTGGPTFPSKLSRGTTDTLAVARTVEGAPYGGTLCLTTARPGSSVTPTTCASWSIPGTTVAPPDSARGITITPIGVSLPPGASVQFTAVAWAR